MVTWQDKGFIVRVKKLSENDSIIDVFTRSYGRYSGVVRGGQSSKKTGFLQPGNYGNFQWKARLEKHLGHFTFDITEHYASLLIVCQKTLYALNLICHYVSQLPERQESQELYDVLLVLFEKMILQKNWFSWFVYFEYVFLKESGFGIDITECAVTQAVDGLTHVSPKTGRAVCYHVAQPYEDKLLRLPSFLSHPDEPTSIQDVLDGFTLMEHFLYKNIYYPYNKRLPLSRGFLIECLEKTKD